MKFRLSSLIILVFAVAAGTLLFWTSQKVQMAEAHLRQVSAAVAGEENTIRVLKAEWAYLTRPDRLEALARTHLGMKPVAADQVAASPDAIPTPAQPNPPGHKPSKDIQPAVLKSPVIAEPSAAAPLPEATPPSPPQRSFRSLLDDIGKAGGNDE